MTDREERLARLREEQQKLKAKLDDIEARVERATRRVRRGPPGVIVNINGNDEEVAWTQVRPGVFMCPAIDGIAPIAFMGHGSLIIGYMNCFAGTGDQEVNTYTVPPGYARWYLVDDGLPPDDRRATRAGRHNAKTHPAITHTHSGLEMSGVKSANEPGGQGIYHTSDWATGCSDGLRSCLRLALGWANRMPIFRLRRDMWDDMAIAPHEFRAGQFQGMDRTRTYGPDGYGGAQKVDGYDGLDHAHLNRMTHPVGVIAARYEFGVFLLAMLFRDVQASWFITNASDDKIHQHHWWSLTGMQRHYRHGIGCPELGRAWAAVLQVLAWCMEIRQRLDLDMPYWDNEAIDDAVSMATDAMARMQHPDGWLYVIYPELPNGTPSPRYQHKVYDEQWSHHIPEGQQPPAFKGFEQELVYLAVSRCICTGDPVADGMRHIADQLATSLRSDMRTRQLMVVGQEDWSSDELTNWQPFIYGYADNLTLQVAQSNQPWWSDNPANAFWTAWDL